MTKSVFMTGVICGILLTILITYFMFVSYEKSTWMYRDGYAAAVDDFAKVGPTIIGTTYEARDTNSKSFEDELYLHSFIANDVIVAAAFCGNKTIEKLECPCRENITFGNACGLYCFKCIAG